MTAFTILRWPEAMEFHFNHILTLLVEIQTDPDSFAGDGRKWKSIPLKIFRSGLLNLTKRAMLKTQNCLFYCPSET
jgi:hypothetical protein